MPGSKVLLDTTAATAILNEDSSAIALANDAQTILVPVIVLGELYWGALNSTYVQENMAKIHDLLTTKLLLNCDPDTALVYAEVFLKLRRKGKPIPQNDIWIAALAVQHNLIVATRDEHFDRVDGLSTVYW